MKVHGIGKFKTSVYNCLSVTSAKNSGTKFFDLRNMPFTFCSIRIPFVYWSFLSAPGQGSLQSLLS